uniref:Reverse transcriptase zinc-binding domain-containing protein n=1 Tax=Neogobius melanostomus TaxID=47308 RepID=A0A8C6SKR5_9GOBI
MNILPRYIFLFQNLPIHIKEKSFKLWESQLRNFLWDGSKPRVKMKVLQDNKEKGGLSLPNLKNYFFATHVRTMLLWFNEQKNPKWKQIELKLVKKLTTLIFSKGKVKKAAESSYTVHNTFEIWKTICRKIRLEMKTQFCSKKSFTTPNSLRIKLMKVLQESNQRCSSTKGKWEKELQVIIDEDDWYQISKSNFIHIRSPFWQEFAWKLQLRFFKTPHMISKFSKDKDTAACWRKCGEKEADYLHIFLTCPKIANFWNKVTSNIKQMIGNKVTYEEKHLLLGIPLKDLNKVCNISSGSLESRH